VYLNAKYRRVLWFRIMQTEATVLARRTNQRAVRRRAAPDWPAGGTLFLSTRKKGLTEDSRSIFTRLTSNYQQSRSSATRSHTKCHKIRKKVLDSIRLCNNKRNAQCEICSGAVSFCWFRETLACPHVSVTIREILNVKHCFVRVKFMTAQLHH
jgi:hypothetical protein